MIQEGKDNQTFYRLMLFSLGNWRSRIINHKRRAPLSSEKTIFWVCW